MRERCLVTGVAGFIGSHLAERLVRDGHQVVGIDCLRDYYSPRVKKANLQWLLQQPTFQFHEVDLVDFDLHRLLDGVGCVFHEAAQPGVRASWGDSFRVYVEDNVLATQRLLEACKASAVRRFVYASSSSVYGDTTDLPVSEQSATRPVSPYGVTKLAAENLCYLYNTNYNIPTVSLRYFTVYGPRQRPDMAFSRFITAIQNNMPIIIYGDGEQTRDFTFVADAIEANLRAMTYPGSQWHVWNIGGGTRASLREVISLLETVLGQTAVLQHTAPQKGDVRHTWADVRSVSRDLDFEPRHTLEEGIRAQVAWQQLQSAREE